MKNRSLMFVPAKEKMLLKLGQMGADIYIVDLEDSIAEDEKEKALYDTVETLNKLRTECPIYIRLNKPRFQDEVTRLEHFTKIGFMLPKFEDISEYQEMVQIWVTHPIIALIETPYGIINLPAIVKCEWIDGLAFGAEDYTAMVNMENSSQKLIYQKSRIITYAKAFGKKVFDTPSFSISDEKRIREEAHDAVTLGFDGKLAIHPKQIPVINSEFSSVDIEYMKTIVTAYEQQDDAVFMFDGKPYEKMHIAHFKRIIKENGGIE